MRDWPCFPACLGHVLLGNAILLMSPRVFRALCPRHAGLFSFPPFPPRPQARQANRGPRRATMPACRPLHGNKSTSAGQQFGQAGHRRRANAITQVFWAIACSTSWACWPIDRPQSRCFFWLLFFSAEKKSDEPRPAGRGTRPAGRPSSARRLRHRPRPRRAGDPRARRRGPCRAAGAKKAGPAPRQIISDKSFPRAWGRCSQCLRERPPAFQCNRHTGGSSPAGPRSPSGRAHRTSSRQGARRQACSR